MYLTVQKIHQGFLTLLHGSEYLCLYFRSLGASVGNNVCLYPNGGDPMMTEPELVTIGDNTSIDDASVIAHINTRGVFKLNPLVIGNNCVLKSNCRLLSGASMEDGSILLEHTLVLAGESVDADTVWQGWPSDVQMSRKNYEAHISFTIEESMQNDVDFILSSGSSHPLTRLSRSRERLSEHQGLLDVSNPSYNSNNFNERRSGGYSVIRDNKKSGLCSFRGVFCGNDLMCED